MCIALARAVDRRIVRLRHRQDKHSQGQASKLFQSTASAAPAALAAPAAMAVQAAVRAAFSRKRTMMAADKVEEHRSQRRKYNNFCLRCSPHGLQDAVDKITDCSSDDSLASLRDSVDQPPSSDNRHSEEEGASDTAPGAANSAVTMVWQALRDGPFFYERMSSAVPGMFLHGGCRQDMGNVEALRVRQYVPPTQSQCWLRIPIRSDYAQQSVPVAERHSYYNGMGTTQAVVGFHRVRWDICIGKGRILCDWRSGRQVVYPSSIASEGVMRNGINDSNHRGVWFYLHWGHPWPASADEIVVEIEVAQSATHKSAKWHLKYCAPGEPPGRICELTRIFALHISSRLLPAELVANWS